MVIFEQFIPDFERRIVLAQNEKVVLLLDNFFGHHVPNVGTRLRVTRLEFVASEHIKSFSIHECMHYCIFQGTIPKVGDSISDTVEPL
jgi:hypothetical protein